MEEEWNSRLAVARLDELTPAHRYRDAQPMHGFCLINGHGGRSRVTLYIENGRALTDRSGAGGFYYEGWLVGGGVPVSLGAFNLGPGGQGSATWMLDLAALDSGRSDLVRVTAEPFGGSEAGSIAVLEGRLVWLETGSVQQPPADPAPPPEAGAPEPVAREVEVREAVLQGAAVGGGASAGLPGEPGPVEAPGPAEEPEPVEEPGPAEEPGPVEEPEPVAAPEAAARRPEPRHANPLEVSVQLVQRHPMAPRASGMATLNLRQGGLTLLLRGLPSPTALGRDQFTDRPFNTYRVWLVNQQTHARTPVGYCHRAWGENFRFQADGLSLNRYDTILVTVEDRSGSGMGNATPQVLMGSYPA